MKIKQCIETIALLGLLSNATLAAPLSAAFAYQGHLKQGNLPVEGLVDLTFQAFGEAAGGIPFEPPVTNLAVWVTHGLFTTLVDLGAPEERLEVWIEIGVRPNGQTGAFDILVPRQLVTPTPFALFADRAGQATNALSVAPAAVTGSMIAVGSIMGTNLADDQVVRSLNNLQDSVRLVPGTNVSISVSGQDLEISATPGTVVTNAGWSVTGNSGTGPSNFLGTLDGQPLELRVNNTRALRLEPTPNTPNVVGGWTGNSVLEGVQGATISGGGNRLIFGAPNQHEITAGFGTIGGGARNRVEGIYGNIGGGYYNSILTNAPYAAVAGGLGDTIEVYGEHAVIGGGQWNNVGLGADSAVIAGGSSNAALSDFAFVGGGIGNRAESGNYTTVAGGRDNTAGAAYASVLGGSGNVADGGSSMVGGGAANQATESYATVPGGFRNEAFGQGATVGGGRNNRSHGPDAMIGGGRYNMASASWAVVAGGYENLATNLSATVAGGSGNIASGSTATVAGGSDNWASGALCAVGGGTRNAARNAYGTVGGGLDNVADYKATVPGGEGNSALGTGSFAAGRHATANHDGAFVWSDGSGNAQSTGANRFEVLSTGGVGFYTGAGGIWSDSQRGLSLSAGDSPMITRGWDPFAASAGVTKSGLGRWGLFMEPSELVAGIPAEDIGPRTFAVAKYNVNGTRDSLMTVSQNGNVACRSLTILGGADLAEPFAMTDTNIAAGAVVVIDENQPGRLRLSTSAYDRKVAGIVSGANGIQAGISMLQAEQLEGGRNVALSGRVYALVDATVAPVGPGDLLTTSDTPGHAMKASDRDRAQGAILGKAMGTLADGRGLVLVLVSLQ